MSIVKIIPLVLLLFSGFIRISYGGTNLTNTVKFASLEQARNLLTTEDAFTRCWSQFDIESRLNKVGGTKDDLLAYISSQARAWKEEEIKFIKDIVKSIDNKIKKQGFKLSFPDEIYFIKTTALEEGGALGYTRANYVVLKDEINEETKEYLNDVVIHELFHVLSRNNLEFRKEMYRLIGFTITAEVTYPEAIKDFRITNPDTPLNDCFITIKKDGKNVDCMMILYTSRAFTGGSFFEYLNVGFLAMANAKKGEVFYANGEPVIYALKDVVNFMEQVGENTGYVIHPEEVLADNFVYAVNNKTNLPSQWLVTNIQKKLKE